MDFKSESFLSDVGVGEINPYALYILITSESGVLLEDIAPLLMGLESAYRRLFALSKDKEVRDLLYNRITTKTALNGVGRSINSKYRKMVVDKKREYNNDFFDSYKKIARQGLTSFNNEISINKEISIYEDRSYKKNINDLKYYGTHGIYPHRIEVSKSKFSSPGFLEILGDPNTLTQLIVLFGFWISEKRDNRNHRHENVINSNNNQRENINTLFAMGYSREEIEAISGFLDKDFESIFKALKEARLQIAPGDSVDQ